MEQLTTPVSGKTRRLIDRLARCMYEPTATFLAALEKEFPPHAARGDKFLYIPGESPVCFVAHVDIFHMSPPHQVWFSRTRAGAIKVWGTDKWRYSEGIGADDRCGVFLMRELLRRGSKAHFLFTDGEERGLIGARESVPTLKKTPQVEDIRLFIQLDRKGINDAVFYGCNSKEARQYVKRFGYTEAAGSCSDISAICPALNVAGVNLSVGYENAHSRTEFVLWDAMMATLLRVRAMEASPPRRVIKYGKLKVLSPGVFNYGSEARPPQKAIQTFSKGPCPGTCGKEIFDYIWQCPNESCRKCSVCCRCPTPSLGGSHRTYDDYHGRYRGHGFSNRGTAGNGNLPSPQTAPSPVRGEASRPTQQLGFQGRPDTEVVKRTELSADDVELAYQAGGDVAADGAASVDSKDTDMFPNDMATGEGSDAADNWAL